MTYNKEAQLEKKQAKARLELKRKQRKEKARNDRFVKEEAERKKEKQVNPHTDFAGNNRKDRRAKAKQFGLTQNIVGINEPIVGKVKSDEPIKTGVMALAKSHLRIMPIHFIPSMEVTDWNAVEEDALEMARIMFDKVMQHSDDSFHCGNAWALHHSQVSERPFNFFVLNTGLATPDIIEKLGSQFIINPKIKSILPDMVMEMKEGCVSFPHRKEKKVPRAIIIKVEYDIPDTTKKGALKHISMEVQGIVAQIFQHEVSHGEGRNIYYDSPKK